MQPPDQLHALSLLTFSMPSISQFLTQQGKDKLTSQVEIHLKLSSKMSALIFDNGSGFTKAGIARDRAPRLVFSTSVAVTPDRKEFYVGDKAQAKRDRIRTMRAIMENKSFSDSLNSEW